MPAREEDQLGMDERTVEDKDLETALERRLRASDDVKEVRTVYKAADTEVRRAIEKLEPAVDIDMPIRIGRFRITKTEIPARSVSFDTEPSERLSISLIES